MPVTCSTLRLEASVFDEPVSEGVTRKAGGRFQGPLLLAYRTTSFLCDPGIQGRVSQHPSLPCHALLRDNPMAFRFRPPAAAPVNRCPAGCALRTVGGAPSRYFSRSHRHPAQLVTSPRAPCRVFSSLQVRMAQRPISACEAARAA